MTHPALVVCSFHSEDTYYTDHADALRENLDVLGVEHVIEPLPVAEDEDWADVCRKKIGFIAQVCRRYPHSRVAWIDVDCRLLSVPEYLSQSTADLAGFQRGFGSPLTIGYANRSRFWEPSLLMIGATPQGREFIATAVRTEQAAAIKATDDYFFEEAWRSLAKRMTFQVLPTSGRFTGRSSASSPTAPFFVFGSSGNVSDFKEKVVQHRPPAGTSPRRQHLMRNAKRLERALPSGLARSMRSLADRTGVTGRLTGTPGQVDAAGDGTIEPTPRQQVNALLWAAQRGDGDQYSTLIDAVRSARVLDPPSQDALKAAESFAAYSLTSGAAPIDVAWWPSPFPGNFGDWLSPFIVSRVAGGPVKFVSPTSRGRQQHLFAIGSIGRFITTASVVVGTGISSDDVNLDPHADYMSVRGPLTAAALQRSGGPRIESFGDPGLLLSRVVPLERRRTNGRTAFIRHHSHKLVPVRLPESWDELSVFVSHPDGIEAFLTTLIEYDSVVTSALHVQIACHSYGIPCALITFRGFEDSVHGSGVKYSDYSLGAGFQTLLEPTTAPLDLRRFDAGSALNTERVDAQKIDEIESALRRAIARVRS